MGQRSTFLLLSGLLLQEIHAVPLHATWVSSRDVESRSYDFIIAGGGVSGLTTADRLSENPDVNVLIIEAGPVDRGEDFIYVPGAYDSAPYAWHGLITEPQTALNNRVFETICAKVTGGGSTINAMNFLRGTAIDYDGWESLGNEGWGWDAFLPYFIKSENLTEPTLELARESNITWDDSIHGHAGPVQFTFPNYIYPGLGPFHESVRALGIEPRLDPSAGSNTGIFTQPVHMDARTWTRSSAKQNHYDPANDRPNYHFLPDITVSKIIFQGDRAIGVQYLPTSGGRVSTVFASKEVLVAAGALHTPQILQLSGVGPRGLLDSLNIPIVSDLPGVGQNLQDQSTFPMTYTWTDSITPNVTTFLTNSTWAGEQRRLYDQGLPSVWTVTRHLVPKFVFVSYRHVTQGTPYENILPEAIARDPADSLLPNVDPTVLAGYKAQRQLIFKEFLDPEMAIGSIGWDTDTGAQIFFVKPLSRGYVNINTTNPLANPVVDFRSSTDPTDLGLILPLFRKQRELFSQAPLASLGPVELNPGDNIQTDEEVIEAMRQVLIPSNAHQCCTAAMMPLELGGVVSSEMKVYGTTGLRVIDISYMPKALSGPPVATMFATAEKISAMIKGEYSL